TAQEVAQAQMYQAMAGMKTNEVLKIEGFDGDDLINKKEEFKGRLLDYIKNDLSDDKLEKFVVKRKSIGELIIT
ncbi:MAG: hypothetical protein ACFNUA_10235, partial [Haemophilus parainfluenzae]